MRQPSILRIFLSISIITAIAFFLVGMLLFTLNSVRAEGQFIIDNQMIDISSEDVATILGMEIPLMKDNVQASKKWFSIFSIFTPKEPTYWIQQELPLYSLIPTDSTNSMSANELPMELAPPEDFFLAQNNKDEIVENTNQNDTVPATTGDKKVVFIYHTHNRESFLPELDTNEANEAYDQKTNVTLVGKQLGKELENLGIGTVVSTKDYWPELEHWSLSYKYSLETVQAALKQNDDYRFIFDIHRDANVREKTTVKIDKQDYAAVYFIIGESNKNYKQNKEFALQIHNSLEKLYPGLSKGIYEKQKTSGTNGEYNQFVSPYSLTIEIGGVYNTLEEEYRTARALAEAVADVYWQAEKVDAPLE